MNATATMTAAGAQHMRALERANEVRLARAELKRGVADGIIDVAKVILTPPMEAESMAIADLLTSQRRWGQTRMRRFLAGIPIMEMKTIGSMTERQRRELARTLGEVQEQTDHSRRRTSVPSSAVRVPAALAG